MSEKTRTIGPYSIPATFAKLDGRTREATLMRRMRAELVEYLGGSPTVIQKYMIEQAVMLKLRLALLDRKIVAAEEFTLPDLNYYIAWSNSLVRTLARLGVEGPPMLPSDPMSSLRDHLALRRGGSAAA